MKKTLIALVLLASSIGLARDTHVNGYYRSNGTYVQPHYRSAPDSSKTNNWSSKGNYNPYTGQSGTKDPYSSDDDE